MLNLMPVAFTLLFAFAGTTHAQSDALAKCLADNTTGKDRKDLARWVFVAMAAHPEMRDIASPTTVVADQAYVTVGKLVTRLLTENCPKEVRMAVEGNDGSKTMRQAFEKLGQLAMQELMSNRDVALSVSKFEQYVDREKVTAVITPK